MGAHHPPTDSKILVGFREEYFKDVYKVDTESRSFKNMGSDIGGSGLFQISG